MLSPETQNTDISTGPVVVWFETIPLCQGLVFATGHQRSRARICDWTSKALKACLMGWDTEHKDTTQQRP